MLLPALMGQSRGGGDQPQAGSDPRTQDPSREIIARAAQRFRLYGGPDQSELHLEQAPVLRWPNPTRATTDGATFVWTRKGRPEAMACIWRHGIFSWAFHSLSELPIRADLDGNRIWEPKLAGVHYQRLENAPRPAKTATARLTQMRNLARRFRCRMSGNEVGELRLLPQPIYRYSVDDERILDGALFAFAQGTDPEVILTIEAVSDESGASWRYAITRRSMVALEAQLDEAVVWSVPGSGGSRTEVWFQSGLADPK